MPAYTTLSPTGEKAQQGKQLWHGVGELLLLISKTQMKLWAPSFHLAQPQLLRTFRRVNRWMENLSPFQIKLLRKGRIKKNNKTKNPIKTQLFIKYINQELEQNRMAKTIPTQGKRLNR